MRRFLHCALLLVSVLAAGTVGAQQFPTKPARIVVAFPPGGPADVLGRSLAERLQKLWGGAVIVENKPGANSIIGTDYVAKQIADGHTLLLANDPPLSSNHGQIDMTLTAIGPSLPHIRSGKFKAIAVASQQRYGLLPDVPTFAEAGLPFEARSWFMVAAPAGAPRPLVDRIAADVKRVVGTQEYREKFIDAMGLEPFNLGPDELASFLQKDRAKYAERVKNANVRLD